MLSGRKLHDELLDEGSHVLVGDNLALPLLDTEYALGNLDGQVTLDLALATQTPVVLDLLASKVTLLRVQNLTAALNDLAFALTA